MLAGTSVIASCDIYEQISGVIQSMFGRRGCERQEAHLCEFLEVLIAHFARDDIFIARECDNPRRRRKQMSTCQKACVSGDISIC